MVESRLSMQSAPELCILVVNATGITLSMPRPRQMLLLRIAIAG